MILMQSGYLCFTSDIKHDKIKVRFNDNKLTDRYTNYREFKSDNRLCSVLDKSICGIGYVGIGEYSPTYTDIDGNTIYAGMIENGLPNGNGQFMKNGSVIYEFNKDEILKEVKLDNE